MVEAPPRDLIGRVLAPAVQLWLHSQTERLGELQVAIAGRNRQLLSGYIPEVSLAARAAVYQGLHVERVELTGANIRINLGQVLRGRPLRLLEPIAVCGQLQLTAANLRASLTSPLLASALNDLWQLLAPGATAPAIAWQQVDLSAGRLVLAGTATPPQAPASPVRLETGLTLASPQQLCLAPLAIEADWLRGDRPESLAIDLGEGVAFDELCLNADGLRLQGSIQIQPEPPGEEEAIAPSDAEATNA